METKKFKFITESNLRKNHLELTNWQSARLREKLPKGIYWVQLVKKGLIHWNYDLLLDFITNGDSPSHQKLVEEFLKTLPQED